MVKIKPRQGLLDSPLDLPQFQIAGIDPLRERAITLGENLVGSFRPFVEGARDQSLAGQQALTSGLQFLQPEAIQQFQNPFQQQVIDASMRELDRQASLQRSRADAQQSELVLLVGQDKVYREQKQIEVCNKSKQIRCLSC